MASKDTFRGAAASLFLAGSILAGMYYFQPEIIAGETNSGGNPEDNLDLTISRLADQGHIVLTEEEHSKQLNQFKDLQTENEELHKQVKQLKESIEQKMENLSYNPSESSEPLFYSILSIEQGMTSQDISSKLLKLKIIKNRDSFEQELAKNEVEDRIQIGQYTLNNQMSTEEIVQLITSY